MKANEEKRSIRRIVSRRQGKKLESVFVFGVLLGLLDLIFIRTGVLLILMSFICFISFFTWIIHKNEIFEYDENGFLFKRGAAVRIEVPWRDVRRVYYRPGPLVRRFDGAWMTSGTDLCIDYTVGPSKKTMRFDTYTYCGTDDFYEYAAEVLNRRPEA